MAGAMNEQLGRTTCERCGTCCGKGGPALHGEDLPLVQDHRLLLEDLITIRLGEPVFSPLSHAIEPSRTELIKVSGRNETWTCRFFSRETMACGIYGHRPLECRLLKCWDPSALTRVIYQQCLTRQDIMPGDEELTALIEIQEEHCTFLGIDRLAQELNEGGGAEGVLREIERMVSLDLKIRQRALQVRGLSLAEELFYFGRPLFKSLAYYQLTVQMGFQGVRVRWIGASS